MGLLDTLEVHEAQVSRGSSRFVSCVFAVVFFGTAENDDFMTFEGDFINKNGDFIGR